MRKETVMGRRDAPYAKAVKANGFLFVSGNVARADGTIEGQTREVLETLQGLVESLGSSFDDVVKVSIFLNNMDDFSAMNEVYKQFFTAEPPTRTTVGVEALSSSDFLVEIDLIAAV